MLTGILRKQGFAPHLCNFFQNYLSGRQTQFVFNGKTLDPTDFTVGVGQGSVLSPILSGLYIALILHKWAPTHLKLGSNMTVQFFVDNGLIHVAAPFPDPDTGLTQLDSNMAVIAHVFHNIVSDLTRLGLSIEPDKLELMHFHRYKELWHQAHLLGPDLALKVGDGLVCVVPKQHMRYLGFYLDPKLSFHHHVRYYATKACSTVATLRMLGSSIRGLRPVEKRRLYLSNVLPVMTYGAQLWWHPSWKGHTWIADELQKVQNCAAKWITESFCTTPRGALSMLAGLIPVRHQVNKLMHNAAFRVRTLHRGHPLRASLPSYWTTTATAFDAAFPLQATCSKKSSPTPLTHVDSIARGATEEFSALHEECRPGCQLRDVFRHRLRSYTNTPKKNTMSFRHWKNKIFLPRLRDILGNPAAQTIFTNGS